MVKPKKQAYGASLTEEPFLLFECRQVARLDNGSKDQVGDYRLPESVRQIFITPREWEQDTVK